MLFSIKRPVNETHTTKYACSSQTYVHKFKLQSNHQLQPAQYGRPWRVFVYTQPLYVDHDVGGALHAGRSLLQIECVVCCVSVSGIRKNACSHDHITLRFWASLDVSDSGFVFWDRNFIFFSLLINLFWTFFYFVFIMLGFPGITWNYFITWKLPGQDQNYPEITWFRVEWKHCIAGRGFGRDLLSRINAKAALANQSE